MQPMSEMWNRRRIALLLVDDQTLVRAGMARLLAEHGDIELIGEAASGEEALELVRQRRPDMVLLDACVSGMGGIEATHALLKCQPGLKIVAMSSIASGIIPRQMLRAGALAFVPKSAAVPELIRAIRLAAQGQRYMTPELADQLRLDDSRDKGKGLFEKLSRRELQIAQLLTGGMKVNQIATALDLRPKTVYSYRYRIFEKLGIRSDVELTVLAVQHGLTPDTRELDHYPWSNRAAS